jgi:predicted Zn-dependent protease
MAKLLPIFSKQIRRRWFYGFMAFLVSLGIVIGTARPAPAQSFLDLIFRGVQVIQLSTMSDRQEVAIGGQINEQLTRQRFRMYQGSDINRYVDGIGQRLVPHSDRSNIPYVFQVVQDNQINAFATMGGYVYVTTGLMRAADNEAQLASVIGHEIGHIVARHAVKQMRQAAIAQGVMTAAGVNQSAIVNIGVELAVRRRNSRQDELEADQLGLKNLQDAGYAPSAAVAFMEKLMRQGSPPAFLSTHPATSRRIDDLNAMIDPETADVGDGLDNAAYASRIRPLL